MAEKQPKKNSEQQMNKDLMKYFKSLDKNTTALNKSVEELKKQNQEQIKLLKQISGFSENSFKFQAETSDVIFSSQKEQEDFNTEMIDAQDKMSELTDAQLEALMNMDDNIKEQTDVAKEQTDIIKEQLKEEKKKIKEEKKKIKEEKTEKKQEERKEKVKEEFYKSSVEGLRTEKKSKPVGGMYRIATGAGEIGQSIGWISGQIGLTSSLMEIVGQFENVTSLMDNVLLKPMRGLFNIGAGLLGMKTKTTGSPSAPLTNSPFVPGNDSPSDYLGQVDKDFVIAYMSGSLTFLEEIADNTAKEKKMIRGKDINLMDWLKKLKKPDVDMERNRRQPSGNVPGAFGWGKMLKGAAIGTLVLGGLALGVEDFMEGFEKGGIKGGLMQAFVGKVSGSVLDSFKNAGKYALMGAGVGMFFGLPGLFAGGVMGAGIGFLINSITSEFSVPQQGFGKSISNILVGSGKGGIMDSFKRAGTWSAIGAGVGIAFGLPGIIAGGAIGFAAGFIFDFVRQILDPSVYNVLETIGGWITSTVSSGFDRLKKGFAKQWMMMKASISFLGDKIKEIFGRMREGVQKTLGMYDTVITYISEQLGIGKYYKEAKQWVNDKISATTDMAKRMFDSMYDFTISVFGDVIDSFKTVMSGYYKRVKSWLGIGDSDVGSTVGSGEVRSRKDTSSAGVPGVTNTNNTETINNKTTNKNKESTTNLSVIKESKKIDEKNNIMNINTATNTETVANASVNSNTILQSMEDSMLKLKDFLIGKFPIDLDKMMTKNAKYMQEFFQRMKLEDRLYKEFEDYGSVKDFGKKYESYAEELNRLATSGREVRQLGTAVANVNSNFSQVINNMNRSGDFSFGTLPSQ